MKCSDPNLQLGSIKDRKDHHATTKFLMKLREEQGRTNAYIPIPHKDPTEEHSGPRCSKMAGMAQLSLGRVLLTTDLIFILFVEDKIGGNGKTLNGKITSGMNVIGRKWFMSEKVFLTDIFFAYRHQQMSCTRREVKTAYLVSRTFVLFFLIVHSTAARFSCGRTATDWYAACGGKTFSRGVSVTDAATTGGSRCPGVAIDWVTGRSYSLEEARRLNVQSGLRKEKPERSCCYLRSVPDLLADGEDTLRKANRRTTERPSIPFGAMVECYPTSARDQSRLH